MDVLKENRLVLLSRTLSAAAHEINNANQTILLGAQIFQEAWERLGPIADDYHRAHGDFSVAGVPYTLLRDQLGENVRAVLRAAESAQKTLVALRSFAKADPDGPFQSVSLNVLIQSTETLLRHTIRRATDRFVLDLAPDLPPVEGNAASLQQVLINLIESACESLPSKDRRVSVVTRHERESSSVVCRVEHRGTGLARQERERVRHVLEGRRSLHGDVDPRFVVLRQVIADHGGAVKMRSSPDRGTSIMMTLPARERSP